MKHLIIFSLALFFLISDKTDRILFIESNTNQEIDCDLRNGKDECPEFVGGNKEMFLYINRNLKYKRENHFCIYIKTNIQFDVLEDGELDNIKIIKISQSSCPVFEQELINVFQNMPRWKPAKLNDKFIKTTRTVFISGHFFNDDD